MAEGILGNKREMTVGSVTPVQKQDFISPAEQDEIMKQYRATKLKSLDSSKEKVSEDAIGQLNSALSGKNEEAKKNEEEMKEMDRYSEEDLELASQLLFTGSARKNVKILKTTATIFSVSSMEMAIINDIMYEMVKGLETKEGGVDASQKDIDMNHALLLLAISFKGYNDKEICESTKSLEMIKSACKKLVDIEVSGEIDRYKAMMSEIKKAVKARAMFIKNMPATIVDVISRKRYEFESEMYDILSRGNIIPKS